MRKTMYLAVLLLMSFGTMFPQKLGALPSPGGLKLEFTEVSTELTCFQSRIGIEAWVRRLKLEAWYLASNPYPQPGAYFELGSILSFAFIDDPAHILRAGAGAAYGVASSLPSFPAVLSLADEIRLSGWLSLDSSVKAMIYADGFVVDLSSRFRCSPLPWLFTGLGAGVDFGGSGEAGWYAWSWRLLASLGATIGRDRR